jgi:MOSC domain-containing protein YiiM
MTFNPCSGLQRLLDAPVRPGRLVWIGVRLARRGPIASHVAATFSPEAGLIGDRYGGRSGGKRQVTLISQEALAAVAAFLGRPEAIAPELVRRNLVVAGMNLLALKGRFIGLGFAEDPDVVLEVTGECHPCSRMEELLGPGGYNALRGHGGLTARVVRGGPAVLESPVRRLDGLPA